MIPSSVLLIFTPFPQLCPFYVQPFVVHKTWTNRIENTKIDSYCFHHLIFFLQSGQNHIRKETISLKIVLAGKTCYPYVIE